MHGFPSQEDGSRVTPSLDARIAAIAGRQARRNRTAAHPSAVTPPFGYGAPFATNAGGSDMALHTYGTMGVDWEERVRFDRLREERLARIKAELEASDVGALLCFDMTNIRYVTATHIGTWAQDKLNRFCLLTRGDDPIMWDFGSAARHHQLYNPWLGEGARAPASRTLRGAMSAESGRAEDVAPKIKVELEQRGLLGEPLGVDAIEPPVLFALQARWHRDRRRPAAHAAGARDQDRDEITLLNTACMMVDAAYEELYRAMRPGIRENECVALVNQTLYDMGSEFVEGVNAISGEAAHRTRTYSPTAPCGPATRRTSTSCTRSTVTGRATTARSPSPAPRPRWSTPTGAAVTT